ncbi:MAG: hypothetical protein JJE35_09620 [Thermoleophilia bacterium]|nr:hypothetical protein [Thermoleophilia bacterium]
MLCRGGNIRRGRGFLAAVIAGLVFVIAVTGALAATPPTREEYKAMVEPICKANTKANERILGGVRKQVKEGKLKAAGAQFAKAATALKKARRELLAVPQPSADKTRLDNWFGYVKTEAELFDQTARKLKQEDKPGANQMLSKLIRTANRANIEVLPFEFTYCRLEPSRFT